MIANSADASGGVDHPCPGSRCIACGVIQWHIFKCLAIGCGQTSRRFRRGISLLDGVLHRGGNCLVALAQRDARPVRTGILRYCLYSIAVCSVLALRGIENLRAAPNNIIVSNGGRVCLGIIYDFMRYGITLRCGDLKCRPMPAFIIKVAEFVRICTGCNNRVLAVSGANDVCKIVLVMDIAGINSGIFLEYIVLVNNITICLFRIPADKEP